MSSIAFISVALRRTALPCGRLGCSHRLLAPRHERRRLNHGYANYDDWRDKEVERPKQLTDVSVGETLEARSG